MPSASPPAGVQGPLRLAVVVLVVGVLAVWLVKPIGNPCPDLARLPPGSTATSSPSFSPPLTRTCTYTAALGIEARARYVPWLDWLVIALIAAVAGGVASLVAPAGRRPREPRSQRPAHEAREPRLQRPGKEPPAPRPQRPAKEPRAGGAGAERDAAERERARRERAERARRDR